VTRVKLWQVSSAHQGRAFLCTTAQCCAHSCCRTRCECLFGAVLSFSPSSPLSCFCTSWPVAAVDTRQPSLRLGVSVSWRRSMRPLAGACASACAPQSTQFGLMCGASCASVMVTALTIGLREGWAERTWSRFSGPGLTERMPRSWSCEFPALRDYVRKECARAANGEGVHQNLHVHMIRPSADEGEEFLQQCQREAQLAVAADFDKRR